MNAKTRVLITGCSGFVGTHLARAINTHFGAAAEVFLTSRVAGVSQLGAVAALDVTDASAVAEAVACIRPTCLVHLSALSAPAEAESDPRRAWEVNTLGTRAVAEAVVRSAPDCRLVFASTGLVYGGAATVARPFTEESLLEPESEYAVTKAAADLLVGAMARRGLQSVRLRLFNHTGPGQSELFAVPSFAAQIARIETGLQEPTMKVGRLDALRDFLDIRDVTAAYLAVIEQSADLPPNPIFNVASGVAHDMGFVLAELISLSSVKIEVVAASPTIGGAGAPHNLVGDPTAAARWLSWRPRYGLRDTLRSTLNYWRERYSKAEHRELP
jgi:GDP-4-dehydro-6-deoxy-D-mannose reductase